MEFLRQSTSVTKKMGPFVDDSDGKTAETGLTISESDVRLSKNGGDFVGKNDSGSATHDESGYYAVGLNATDTNTLGSLLVTVHESGALPVWQDFMVIPAHIYDWLFGSSGLYEKAAKLLVNKAVQTKSTGSVVYYDDDGVTPLVTVTPTEDSTTITRTPS